MLYIASVETTSSSVAGKRRGVRSTREKVVLAAGSVVTFLLLGGGVSSLQNYSGPWKVKLALLLAIWGWTGGWLWYAGRYRREDEMEILMNRRALAFAFYASLVVVMILHQLQWSGLIPVLYLRTEHIFPGLMVLMAIGLVISKIRYR